MYGPPPREDQERLRSCGRSGGRIPREGEGEKRIRAHRRVLFMSLETLRTPTRPSQGGERVQLSALVPSCEDSPRIQYGVRSKASIHAPCWPFLMPILPRSRAGLWKFQIAGLWGLQRRLVASTVRVKRGASLDMAIDRSAWRSCQWSVITPSAPCNCLRSAGEQVILCNKAQPSRFQEIDEIDICQDRGRGVRLTGGVLISGMYRNAHRLLL
jgi:hypothetical protein